MTEHSWTCLPLNHEYVRGAARLERTVRGIAPHRLPAWVLRQAADPQIAMAQSQPSGVRIALRTSGTAVQLTAYRSRLTYAGLPPRPDGIIDLVIDHLPVAHAATSGGSTTIIDMTTGQPTVDEGTTFTHTFRDLPDGVKNVELWLPHNETIEVVDVRVNAEVEPVTDERRRWVHHGSSISHGSNATRPSQIWPVSAARIADVNLTNLGFGGSALLDPFIARTIRDMPADIISLKIGINLVNSDLMRMRALRSAAHGFLDTVREGHPETPLLVVSPIHCAIHESTPGPGAFDLDALAEGHVRFRATGDPDETAAGKLTLRTIRAELERIVTERQDSDQNLFYLNGLTLYGPADEEHLPLTDALHPDAQTHQIMAKRFTRQTFTNGPFATHGRSTGNGIP